MFLHSNADIRKDSNQFSHSAHITFVFCTKQPKMHVLNYNFTPPRKLMLRKLHFLVY